MRKRFMIRNQSQPTTKIKIQIRRMDEERAFFFFEFNLEKITTVQKPKHQKDKFYFFTKKKKEGTENSKIHLYYKTFQKQKLNRTNLLFCLFVHLFLLFYFLFV